MTGFLFRAKLTLTKSSTVAAVEVRLSDNKTFSVDRGRNPWTEDLTTLPPPPPPPQTFAIPNPFSITDSKTGSVYSTGMLNFDSNAIAEWQQVFRNGTPISVQMQLSNKIIRVLSVDMCVQSTMVTAAQKVQNVVLATASFALTVLNFLAELVTLRIFRRSKPPPEIPDSAPTRGHERAAREG
jgi:hypothetical protein